MNKEIIGYKLIKEEYNIPALKIMDSVWRKPTHIVSSESDIKKLKEAGVLDLWFEPVYEELKVNDYIVFQNLVDEDELSYNGDIVKITSIRDDKFHEKWINHTPNSFTGGGFGYKPYKNNIRLATLEEIEMHKNNLLLEEAEKRYPVGTKFLCAHIYNKNYFSIVTNSNFKICKRNSYDVAICAMTDDNTCFASSQDSKYGNTNCDRFVYVDGKWAEIISSSLEIIINGYKAEFFDDYVKFGCAEISKYLFIELHKVTKGYWKIYGNKNIESITIGKGTFSREQIKQIAEYYTK